MEDKNKNKIDQNTDNKKSQNTNQELEKKISELEAQIAKAVEMMNDLESSKMTLDGQLRKALADYANLQRDMDKRNEIALSQLKAKAALEIISVIDDVNFALQAKENLSTEISDHVKSWIEGLVATLNNLKKALDVLGVRPMGCKKGDKYNSAIHMALSIVPTGDPDTLVEIVQDGYVLGGEDGMIVRPARVIVAKKVG